MKIKEARIKRARSRHLEMLIDCLAYSDADSYFDQTKAAALFWRLCLTREDRLELSLTDLSERFKPYIEEAREHAIKMIDLNYETNKALGLE